MKDVILQLGPILGGIAGIVALLTIPAQRRKLRAEGRKSDADAAKVLGDAAVSLLEPAQEQIRLLKAELAEAKAGAKLVAEELRKAQEGLVNAQAEIQALRNHVDAMSKDLAEQRTINEQLRDGRGT